MCVALIYHDRNDAFPLRVLETRDENIYRLHGSRAVQFTRGVRTPSFAPHWQDAKSLADLFIVHDDPSEIIAALPVGGYDRFGGTWVAVSQATGVYARLLIAVFSDGTFAESPTPEMMQRRLNEGFAKRGGLCLDAVAFPSARLAAQNMPDMVCRALSRNQKKFLPHYLLVADAADAFVFHLDETGVIHVIDLPQRELTVLSIRGINSTNSPMTQNFLEPLRKGQLPRPTDSHGWDEWIRICSIEENFSDKTARNGAIPYLDPKWRSHQHSIIQPAYLNVPGPRNHMRADAKNLQVGDVVEWTTSSTCVSADRFGRLSFITNERQLEENAPFADTIAGSQFPCSTNDYNAVPLDNGFGPSSPTSD